MAFELNGFSDAILTSLSDLGIQIICDKNDDHDYNIHRRAIYEIFKHQSKSKPKRKD